MDTVSYWIAAAALLGSGIIYVHTIEARGKRGKRLLLAVLAYFLCVAVISRLKAGTLFWSYLLLQSAGLLFLVCILHMGRVLSWTAAVYYAIWAFMSWQLLLELCLVYKQYTISSQKGNGLTLLLGGSLIFIAGHIVMAFTVGKWLPERGKKKIGPRQLTLAALD